MRLVAGLRPDPVGELPRLPSCYKGAGHGVKGKKRFVSVEEEKGKDLNGYGCVESGDRDRKWKGG